MLQLTEQAAAASQAIPARVLWMVKRWSRLEALRLGIVVSLRPPRMESFSLTRKRDKDAETGQITDVNPFMVDMLGYPREHFLGRRLSEIGPFDDQGLSRQAFLQLQEECYGRYEDLPLETFDGRRVQVGFVSNVYTVGDGEVIQCNISSVSARKFAEAALRETSRKIAELHHAAHQSETCEDEEQIYLMAVDAAERVLGFLECSLRIRVGDKLVVKAISSEAVSMVGQEIPVEGRDGGLAAETIRTEVASRFGRAEEAPEPCICNPTLESWIGVPLDHLGAFQIRSPFRRTFTEEDTRLLGLLAGHTAEALRRIRLQQDLREQAARDPLTASAIAATSPESFPRKSVAPSVTAARSAS